MELGGLWGPMRGTGWGDEGRLCRSVVLGGEELNPSPLSGRWRGLVPALPSRPDHIES